MFNTGLDNNKVGFYLVLNILASHFRNIFLCNLSILELDSFVQASVAFYFKIMMPKRHVIFFLELSFLDYGSFHML